MIENTSRIALDGRKFLSSEKARKLLRLLFWEVLRPCSYFGLFRHIFLWQCSSWLLSELFGRCLLLVKIQISRHFTIWWCNIMPLNLVTWLLSWYNIWVFFWHIYLFCCFGDMYNLSQPCYNLSVLFCINLSQYWFSLYLLLSSICRANAWLSLWVLRHLKSIMLLVSFLRPIYSSSSDYIFLRSS